MGLMVNGNKPDGLMYNGEVIHRKTLTIKPFAEATDEEIAHILDLHYQGQINIDDYWAIGDTRVMHLDYMPSGTGANETHVAQDIRNRT